MAQFINAGPQGMTMPSPGVFYRNGSAAQFSAPRPPQVFQGVMRSSTGGVGPTAHPQGLQIVSTAPNSTRGATTPSSSTHIDALRQRVAHGPPVVTVPSGGTIVQRSSTGPAVRTTRAPPHIPPMQFHEAPGGVMQPSSDDLSGGFNRLYQAPQSSRAQLVETRPVLSNFPYPPPQESSFVRAHDDVRRLATSSVMANGMRPSNARPSIGVRDGHPLPQRASIGGQSIPQPNGAPAGQGEVIRQETQHKIPQGREITARFDSLLSVVSKTLVQRSEYHKQQLLDMEKVESLLADFKRELERELSHVSHHPPRPPIVSNLPPFSWVPSQDYVSEFQVRGEHSEVVIKDRDFKDQGWVIPVSGTLRIVAGAVYKWSILVVRKCPHRPQLQFGIHGANHEKPWRLLTTSRCSRSRDDDPWQDRPGGDRVIDEGDVIHLRVDARLLPQKQGLGTFWYAINDEEWELAFDDVPIPVGADNALIPVASMGGSGCCVRLLPN